MTVLVTTAFASLADYGAYADKLAADSEWQAFWTDVMKDPSADLIRSGLYVKRQRRLITSRDGCLRVQ